MTKREKRALELAQTITHLGRTNRELAIGWLELNREAIQEGVDDYLARRHAYKAEFVRVHYNGHTLEIARRAPEEV